MPNNIDPAALATAYLEGATLEDLAAARGLSYRAVRTAVLAAGVTLRPAKVRLPPIPAGIVNQYNGGATIRQLAAEYQRTYPQMRRMLLAAGATLRPTGRVRGG